MSKVDASAPRPRLSDEEIQKRMAQLGGWTYEGGKLVRAFEFASFVEAFSWMASIALVAEKLDHHPDWKNVYNRVFVELHTHDSGGVTDRDFDLAGRMTELAGRYTR
jgi:4a-hydroxytetrahydrobiopterin dehydratase